jgi:hypothetical protein
MHLAITRFGSVRFITFSRRRLPDGAQN